MHDTFIKNKLIKPFFIFEFSNIILFLKITKNCFSKFAKQIHSIYIYKKTLCINDSIEIRYKNHNPSRNCM